MGIIAQRLVRTICPNCKEKHPASETDIAFIKRQYGEEHLEELNLSVPLMLYTGKGCDECGDTSYKGRPGVHELLTMTGELRALVYQEVSVHEMKSQALQDGIRISLKYKLSVVLADPFFENIKTVNIV